MKTLKLLGAALAAVTMAFTAQAEKTAKAVVEEDGGATLRFVYDETDYGAKDVKWFSVAEAEAIDPLHGNVNKVPWYGKRSTVTKVVFDSSFAAYRPKQCVRWFEDFRFLAAVDGLTNLDTSVANNMNSMFSGCSSLTTLDVSGFNTAKVTDMEGMFNDCSSLTALDVSGFNTANVFDMCRMFYGCLALTTLDVSGFDTANVMRMNSMFYGCSLLTTLNLASFNTANVTEMNSMFYGCSSLKAICASDRFVTDRAWDSTCMFQSCKKLKGGAGTEYDIYKTDKTYARIDGKDDLHGYFTRAPTAKAVVEDGGATLKFVYDESTPTGTKGTDWFSVAEAEAINPNSGDKVPWYGKRSTVTKVVFDPSFADYSPKQCGRWFYGFGVLDAVDGLKNLNTSVATSMAYMFYNCLSLTTLDVSGFDTANVTDMRYMFAFCSSLESLDLTGFDTANVTEMDNMFENCSSLTTLVVTGFDTANVTSMASMFVDCSSLKTLDITGFDTANVTDMGYMFCDCSSLTSLDLTGFYTANVTSMRGMFYGCSSLEAICASDQFVTDKVSDSYSMFENCSKLKGGAGTEYNSDKTDATYAHIDGKDGQPGYFTEKPKTAKAVVENDGKTLRFVYDGKDVYGAKDTGWFSVAEAEAINPNGEDVPWCKCGETVTKVVFDSSFAAYLPKQCGAWFRDFGDLAEVDGLKNLNTSVATSMAYMFSGCSSLESLDLTGFDTANVTSMESMFDCCSSLESLDLTGFDTANVTTMGNMFSCCTMLTTLDVSDFDTANVTVMRRMFCECMALITIYASDRFVTKQVSDSYSMFQSCYQIYGCAMHHYDSFKTDKTYARIDTCIYELMHGGQPTPGYFTYKAPSLPDGSYGIRFAANGGTGTMVRQVCEKGRVYNLTKCAFEAPDGKAFAGWACKKTGKRYDDGILIFNAAAEGKVLTLTAVWE